VNTIQNHPLYGHPQTALVVGRGPSATRNSLRRAIKEHDPLMLFFCNDAIELFRHTAVSTYAEVVYAQYDGPTHPYRPQPAIDFGTLPPGVEYCLVPVREHSVYGDNPQIRYMVWAGVTTNGKPVPTALMCILAAAMLHNQRIVLLGMDAYRDCPDYAYSPECCGRLTPQPAGKLDGPAQYSQLDRMPASALDLCIHHDGQPVVWHGRTVTP
jgi:hypothetical protein